MNPNTNHILLEPFMREGESFGDSSKRSASGLILRTDAMPEAMSTVWFKVIALAEEYRFGHNYESALTASPYPMYRTESEPSTMYMKKIKEGNQYGKRMERKVKMDFEWRVKDILSVGDLVRLPYPTEDNYRKGFVPMIGKYIVAHINTLMAKMDGDKIIPLNQHYIIRQEQKRESEVLDAGIQSFNKHTIGIIVGVPPKITASFVPRSGALRRDLFRCDPEEYEVGSKIAYRKYRTKMVILYPDDRFPNLHELRFLREQDIYTVIND